MLPNAKHFSDNKTMVIIGFKNQKLDQIYPIEDRINS
jgi:hypothetical protein